MCFSCIYFPHEGMLKRLIFFYIWAASDVIPAWTIIEMSPVLFFSPEEYELHGRHTTLDHYTFKWRDGRMALALGLGAYGRILSE